MTEKYAGLAYSVDVADIGEGATYATASGEMNTNGCKCIALMPYATGANASSAGVVTFNLVAMIGGKWCTTTWQSVTLTVSATTEDVSPPVMLNCPGIQAVKVASIVNGDATYHITNVNLIFASPRFFE